MIGESDKKKTAIYLTDEEAKFFILLQEYQYEIELLVEYDVFKIKNGKATLHFDNLGLAQVNTDKIVYKKVSIDRG